MFEIGLMKKDEINIQTPQKARIIIFLISNQHDEHHKTIIMGSMIFPIYFNFYHGHTCEETDISKSDIKSLITTFRGYLCWESVISRI